MKSLNEQLLEDDPESQAIEADDSEPQYTPFQNGSVVMIEPDIITIGRNKRRTALKLEQTNGE